MSRRGPASSVAAGLPLARRLIRLAGLPLLAVLLVPASGRAANPSALWEIVNGQCVPHQEAAHDPAPCAVVDISQGERQGYAVLKDINGVAQYLLIPTARTGGIEDPIILAKDEPNYWQDAWQARTLVEQRLHTSLPRDALSLAINSYYGRTQNQLHIHIDCVSPQVHEIIAASLGQITDTWSTFATPLAGHTYRVRRIRQDTLAGADPFRLLADADPQAAKAMAAHTLVVIGATFPGGDGFVLLDDHADLVAGDRASGEQLQDHTCAIATK